MFFELLENDIVNKLTSDLGSAIQVEAMPDNQAQFSRPFVKSRVDVCYKNSDFDTPNSVYTISQHETQQLELAIQARQRRGLNGIYDVVNKVRKSIVGFSPTHCSKIYLKKFIPEDFKDNLWYYTLVIECKTLINEDYTEPTTPVLIQATTDVTIN